jgi:hypothetical protein
MNTSSKVIILFLAVFSLLAGLKASPVDQTTAKAIATKFMETDDLHLSAVYTTDKNVPAFYIFNTTDGFVIVSADDRETPIIGYSHEGRFDQDNVPVQMEAYLQDFVARIQYGIENHIAADEVTAKQWEMVKKTGRPNNNKAAKSVEPLLTEKWHQGCLYNSLCPSMNGPCDHAEVGCVAVAMGMIMHYWGYPSKGWGSQSYSNAGTTLSADFGNTIYDWEHMPDSLTDASSNTEVEAIATLLFHCGVSVKMRYTNDGSGADSKAIPNAMYSYFNYSRQIHGEKRGTDDTGWLSMLKNNLDMQHPVLYNGNNNTGSHAFVCDGYDSNDLLHFNWGWGGTGDGYFALGNLNPNGYDFNDKHYAVFDIDPHYDPYIVTASVDPPMAGIVEGTGDYHIGETCTLSAIPTDGCEFYCWKQNGVIKSYDPSFSFEVKNDVEDIVACFSYCPIKEIEANCTSDSLCVNLTWSQESTDWVLLHEFDILGLDDINGSFVSGIATNGEYIYTSRSYINDFIPYAYGKYSMEGDSIDQFNLNQDLRLSTLAYDGRYYYGRKSGIDNLFCVDLENKTVVDSAVLEMMSFDNIAYDPINDGFWIDNYTFNINSPQITLIDRQGQVMNMGCIASGYLTGMGYIGAMDGTQHILLVNRDRKVFDYNITYNTFNNYPLITLGSYWQSATGATIGKYKGKDALFLLYGFCIQIYEIKSTLAQIMGYRIYRADESENTVMLADMVEGRSYLDSTWIDAINGVYRYGISSVFANGNESEILWSNPIAKTNYGIEEHEKPVNPNVKKVFENGHIVIIKDGKKYSVMGQEFK